MHPAIEKGMAQYRFRLVSSTRSHHLFEHRTQRSCSNPPPGGDIGGEGGGGSGTPKLCAPKMARPDVPNGKFWFFPRWSLWDQEEGG